MADNDKYALFRLATYLKAKAEIASVGFCNKVREIHGEAAYKTLMDRKVNLDKASRIISELARLDKEADFTYSKLASAFLACREIAKEESVK